MAVVSILWVGVYYWSWRDGVGSNMQKWISGHNQCHKNRQNFIYLSHSYNNTPRLKLQEQEGEVRKGLIGPFLDKAE